MGQRQAISTDKARQVRMDNDSSRFAAILNAAEDIFASSGFDGAKMREIAEQAGVAQGLLHYHFGTKEKLFEAMVARRAEAINDERADLLQTLLLDTDRPTLEGVVNALFRPTIKVGLSLARNGGSFSRVLVSLANSAEPRDKALAEQYYDPIARKFIDALHRACPELSRADSVWSYMFAIGVGMTMMAKTGRSIRLSDGLCDDGDIELMMTKIVPFICGGIRALT